MARPDAELALHDLGAIREKIGFFCLAEDAPRRASSHPYKRDLEIALWRWLNRKQVDGLGPSLHIDLQHGESPDFILVGDDPDPALTPRPGDRNREIRTPCAATKLQFSEDEPACPDRVPDLIADLPVSRRFGHGLLVNVAVAERPTDNPDGEGSEAGDQKKKGQKAERNLPERMALDPTPGHWFGMEWIGRSRHKRSCYLGLSRCTTFTR